ncbi:hypothetical protein [uncultured Limosilactobacillus sp.]|uniref:hypothetical protein n=1 Tax=uncultured Limosilactobacillus sp. TaxID=2837629 RepID=UPI0025D8B7BC|nr:hypothetical protein [uncultured Limosilactobacillus sp.]
MSNNQQVNQDYQYDVTADAVRIIIIDIAYLLIISGLLAILWVHTNLIWKGFAVFFAALFLILVWKTSKPMITHQILYSISSKGITDFTKEQPVTIPWKIIQKIELVPNNATYQIGIIAFDVITDRQKQAQQIKTNYAENGNLAVYSIIIDGFKFRRKPFLKIYNELKRQGTIYNPHILINAKYNRLS